MTAATPASTPPAPTTRSAAALVLAAPPPVPVAVPLLSPDVVVAEVSVGVEPAPVFVAEARVVEGNCEA